MLPVLLSAVFFHVCLVQYIHLKSTVDCRLIVEGTAVSQWQLSLNGRRLGIRIRSRAVLWESWFLAFFSVKVETIHRKLRINVA